MAILNLTNAQTVQGMATTEDTLQTESFEPASTWDVTKAQFAQFRANMLSTSQGDAMYDGFQARNAEYTKQFNSDFPEFEVDNNTSFTFETDEDFRNLQPLTKQRYKQIRQEDEWIIEQRKKDPEKFKNILTSGEIYDKARANANATTAELSNVQSRATGFANIAGTFAGSVAGAMTDPINIATLPFGATRGAGILKTAFTEAGIAGATEAAIQPSVMSWQKQLGQEYGLDDAAMNVLAASTGGFIIGGGVKAGSEFFGVAKNNPNIKKNEVAALHELQAQSQLEEMNVYRDNPDLSVNHINTVKEVNEMIRNGQRINDQSLPLSNRDFNLANDKFRLDPDLAKANDKIGLSKFQNRVFYDVGSADFRTDSVKLSEKASEQFVRFIRDTDSSKATLIPMNKKFMTRSEAEKKIKEVAKEERKRFPGLDWKSQKKNFIINKEGDSYSLYRADNAVGLKKDIDGKIAKFNSRSQAEKGLETGEYIVSLRPKKGDPKQEYIIIQGDITQGAVNQSNIGKTKFYDEMVSIQPEVAIDSKFKAKPVDSPVDIITEEAPIKNNELLDRYRSLEDTREIEDLNSAIDDFLEVDPDSVLLLDDGTQVSLKQVARELFRETEILDMMRTCKI